MSLLSSAQLVVAGAVLGAGGNALIGIGAIWWPRKLGIRRLKAPDRLISQEGSEDE